MPVTDPKKFPLVMGSENAGVAITSERAAPISKAGDFNIIFIIIFRIGTDLSRNVSQHASVSACQLAGQSISPFCSRRGAVFNIGVAACGFIETGKALTGINGARGGVDR